MATVCQTSPLSASLQHQLHGYICALENPYLTTKPSPQQRLNTQLYGEARGNFGLVGAMVCQRTPFAALGRVAVTQCSRSAPTSPDIAREAPPRTTAQPRVPEARGAASRRR